MPRDLNRFPGLPMLVRHRAAGADGGAPSEATDALELVSYDAEAGRTTWRLADVARNRAGLKKGQPMSKKARERRLDIAVADLVRVNLLLDI